MRGGLSVKRPNAATVLIQRPILGRIMHGSGCRGQSRPRRGPQQPQASPPDRLAVKRPCSRAAAASAVGLASFSTACWLASVSRPSANAAAMVSQWRTPDDSESGAAARPLSVVVPENSPEALAQQNVKSLNRCQCLGALRAYAAALEKSGYAGIS